MTSLTDFKIISSKCLPVRLNFRMGVTHGLASRNHTTNVCVVFESDSGHWGYGESVPRQYVTGETTGSALQALSEMMQDFSGKIFKPILQQFVPTTFFVSG